MSRPSLAPSPPPPEPKVRGATRLALGVVLLVVSYFAITRGERGGAFVSIAAGLGFLVWGIAARVWSTRSRKAYQTEQAELLAARDRAKSAPDRIRRLAAWKDGSALAAIPEGEPVLTVPCTWYVDGARGLREKDGGKLVLDRKGIQLMGDQRAQTFRLSSVVEVEAKANALVIKRTNGPHIVVAVDDPEEVALAIVALQ